MAKPHSPKGLWGQGQAWSPRKSLLHNDLEMFDIFPLHLIVQCVIVQRMQTILTTSNDKTLKSLGLGYLTFGIHFAHSDLSGIDVCPDASEGCKASCLDYAGRGQQGNIKEARIEKTQTFFNDIPVFMLRLHKEIQKAINYSEKKGLKPCFRLNLTADIKWERIKYLGKTVFEHFPNVQFYDYTKSVSRMGLGIPNYHLTFSRSETGTNHVHCALTMKAGFNVAAVFSTKKGFDLPSHYNGFQVIDGDKHDLRFLDPKNSIVGLRAKGPARQDTTGFVIHA
jgi:hypothetical protein